ncbi:MAG: RNA chaperone Hfq [Peptostreptococcaceae bacterium]|nr:RNA chaperone Hfq [Peptostreptococcaceae bacterium]
MMKNVLNLQDIILNQSRKDKILLTIFLTNGFQLKGYVKGFDLYTIVIENDGSQQMIYKHAISTIIPSKRVNINQFINTDSEEE